VRRRPARRARPTRPARSPRAAASARRRLPRPRRRPRTSSPPRPGQRSASRLQPELRAMRHRAWRRSCLRRERRSRGLQGQRPLRALSSSGGAWRRPAPRVLLRPAHRPGARAVKQAVMPPGHPRSRREARRGTGARKKRPRARRVRRLPGQLRCDLSRRRRRPRQRPFVPCRSPRRPRRRRRSRRRHRLRRPKRPGPASPCPRYLLRALPSSSRQRRTRVRRSASAGRSISSSSAGGPLKPLPRESLCRPASRRHPRGLSGVRHHAPVVRARPSRSRRKGKDRSARACCDG